MEIIIRYCVPAIAAIYVALCIAGCTPPDDALEPEPEPEPSGISVEGGTVSGGGATVFIPPGALSRNFIVRVTVAALDPSEVATRMPAGFVRAGPLLAFTPHGVQFSENVTLTIPVESTATAIMRADNEVDPIFKIVTGAVLNATEATVETATFSIYAGAEAVVVGDD